MASVFMLLVIRIYKTMMTCSLVYKLNNKFRKRVTIRICEEGRKFLTMHSTHFIYGYMASDIW